MSDSWRVPPASHSMRCAQAMPPVRVAISPWYRATQASGWHCRGALRISGSTWLLAKSWGAGVSRVSLHSTAHRLACRYVVHADMVGQAELRLHRKGNMSQKRKSLMLLPQQRQTAVLRQLKVALYDALHCKQFDKHAIAASHS